MPSRANEPMRCCRDRVERLLRDVLRPAWTEPDDRDAATRHGLNGTTKPEAESHRP